MTSLNKLFSSTLVLTISLVLATLSIHGQTKEAKPKATGSISGRVTMGGKGVPNIPVAAIGLDNLNRRAGNARAVTDNEGYYRLAGLTPAQYQVAPLAPELTATDMESELSFPISYFGSSLSIVLSAGEDVEGVDVKVVHGAVITGRITDADNKPLVEERISLEPLDQNGNPSRIPMRLPPNAQMYTTDDQGVYRIFGLPAGRYRVGVGNNPEESFSFNSRGLILRAYYPSTTELAKASIIDLAEGSETSNVDIQVGARSEVFKVSGSVIDSDTGLSISGVRVGYLRKMKNQERYTSLLVMGPTGPRGEFRFDGLAPGKYGAYVASGFDSGDLYSDPVYFEITDKDVSGIELKPVRGLSISGFIVGENQPPRDLITDLPGLRAFVTTNQGPDPPPGSSASTMVSADGTFQISGLRPGRVNFGLFSNTGRRPSILRMDHDGVNVAQSFELQPGHSMSGLRVVIAYGSGAIRGSIRYEGGTPAPQTRTFITYTRDGVRDQTGVQVDSRGRFLITGLAPGTYAVTLQAAVPGQRPPPLQKQTVTVTNDNESEVVFVVDLTPKEARP